MSMTSSTHLGVTMSQALRFSSALLRMSHQVSRSFLLSAERRCLRMVT